jgi:hypothetical protein
MLQPSAALTDDPTLHPGTSGRLYGFVLSLLAECNSPQR